MRPPPGARWPRIGSRASTTIACPRNASQRAQNAIRHAGLGAVLCFNFDNIRYVTGTHIGEWARDKFMRYALCPARGPAVPVGPGAAGQAHLLALDRRQRRGPDLDHAGRVAATDERAGRLRQADQEGAGPLRHRQGADRHRHHGTADAARAGEGGHRGRRRPAGDARCARGQDRRRDRAPEDGLRHGRRDLRRHRPGDPARARARTNWSRSPTTGCSAWAPSASSA